MKTKASHTSSRNVRLTFLAALAVTLMTLVAMTGSAAAPTTGAIFTTDSTCTGTNINIYDDKGDVYLNGGPAHPQAAGLPDGLYYVQVTDPSGSVVLGKTLSASVSVSGGEFAQCYQLTAYLYSAGSGFLSLGYDDTPNNGGEYKVWVSQDPTFTNSETKTDAFKVKACEGEDCDPQPPQATLHVLKFYDANANGALDGTDTEIVGWKVRIQDGLDIFRFTPVSIVLDPDDYTVTESDTVESNWVHTTDNPVQITLADGDDSTVRFGNVCTGKGGGLTLGFWSNKNGQALFGADDLALMTALNLRNGAGADFDPATYAAYRTWSLGATATNMSYMLSAQLAAMELNVNNGKVGGGSLIYAPGLLPFSPAGLNSLGFISINDLMTDANAELGLHGLVLSGDSNRPYQEALKNALDKANNDTTFVQASPCPFSF